MASLPFCPKLVSEPICDLHWLEVLQLLLAILVVSKRCPSGIRKPLEVALSIDMLHNATTAVISDCGARCDHMTSFSAVQVKLACATGVL